MHITNQKSAPRETVTSPLFTGSDVTRQPLAPSSQDYSVNIINFGKGVRNKLHTHESDQLLIVTAGTGIVATEQEERTVNVGDVILIPAGERHWHGAGQNSVFSHIALTRVGSKLTQIED